MKKELKEKKYQQLAHKWLIKIMPELLSHFSKKNHLLVNQIATTMALCFANHLDGEDDKIAPQHLETDEEWEMEKNTVDIEKTKSSFTNR